MSRWLLWTILGTIAVAVVAHVATLYAIPVTIMNAAIDMYPNNVLMKGGRTTADSRMVVRPSPDIVYSILLYDVSSQPIRLKAQVPTDAYWSAAFYANNTDNYYVVNDQGVPSNPVNILLLKTGAAVPPGETAIIVNSPTDRGIMVIRYLLTTDGRYDDVAKIQNQSSIQIGY